MCKDHYDKSPRTPPLESIRTLTCSLHCDTVKNYDFNRALSHTAHVPCVLPHHSSPPQRCPSRVPFSHPSPVRSAPSTTPVRHHTLGDRCDMHVVRFCIVIGLAETLGLFLQLKVGTLTCNVSTFASFESVCFSGVVALTNALHSQRS